MIDHRIALGVQPANAVQNAFAGLQQGQQYRANKLAMDQQQTEQRRQAAQDIARGVLSAPIEQRPERYRAARQQAQNMGYDLTGYPEEYDDTAELLLHMYVGGDDKATGFVRELQAAGIEPSSPEGRKLLLSKYGAGSEDNSTSAIKEYRFAREQGFRGSFADWKSQNRGGTTVNVGPQGQDFGKPEAGLAWARDQDGKVRLDERGAPVAVPYQGGSVFRDQQAARTAERAGTRSRQQAAGIVVEDIDRAIGIINESDWPTTGLFGEALSSLGGTDARDLRGLIDTVRANAGFDRLQAMRDASPTGGALGAINTVELQRLEASIGNLEQSQGKEQVLYNLRRVRQIYNEIIHGDAGEAPTGGSGGSLRRRYQLLREQYPNDPSRVHQILQEEGLL